MAVNVFSRLRRRTVPAPDPLPSSPAATTTAELIGLREAARTLSLRSGRIRALQGQNHLSPFRGRGMEFDESRPYQPGDDIRSLDWRVTARTGKTHTKLFREERERPVIIAVDLRPAMFFATHGRFKSVQAAHMAALLAWRSTQQGDRLGGFLFGARQHWEARPALGTAATLHFLEQLAQRSRPNGDSGSADPDALQQALARLRRVARPGSLIVLISDFRGLDARGEAHLSQLARHNELLLVSIYDALETQLPPPGRYRLAQAQRELILDSSDALIRERYAQQFQARRTQLEQLSLRYRLKLLACATDEDPLQRLQQGLQMHRP